MVKGLRSPDPLQLDLMRTYSATSGADLRRSCARPPALPFFFASMKIGAAAALVGAIVAEVTKSEDGGLGARLLAGSYYGQTVQIWATLVRGRGPVGRPGRNHRPRRAADAPQDGVSDMNARALADLAPPLVFGVDPARVLGGGGSRWAAFPRSFCRRLRRSGCASSPRFRRWPPISCKPFAACWRATSSAAPRGCWSPF